MSKWSFGLVLSCGLWLIGTAAAAPAFAEEAAVVYRDGHVFTGTVDHVDATWFVVSGGLFVDRGDGPLPARWQHSRQVDLGGRFVAPGFVDAHVHFLDGGLSLLQVDAADARTRDDIRDAVARALTKPLGPWVVVRNVGLDVLGGRYPTHATMADVVAPAADRPVLLLLKGGHHVYANAVALHRLGFDDPATTPAGGQVARDAAGHATGLLVDQAAWNAARALDLDLPIETMTEAVLRAQALAVRYGITTLGDNTFFPTLGAQYARMAQKGLLRLRMSIRSFGPEPMTRLAMKSLGVGRFGRPGAQVRYFGEKYFLDSSLSTAGAAGAERLETGPRYTARELRDLMLYAGPFGTAFHAQSREGAERLVEARRSISHRRPATATDVIDHCGRCGGGDLPRLIKEAGFRVTLLPGQLHDLPGLLRDLPPETHSSLLDFRGLFGAGLEPALTSDWPFGAERSYPDLPDGYHRIGLAPLADLAVAVSGKSPDGAPIEGAASRTIPMGQALLAVTAHGAAAVGRTDVGQIAPGKRADFVVLPVSPFEVDPVTLYRVDTLATYIDGSPVGEALPGDLPAPSVAATAKDVASRPSGSAMSPIFGYDPVPGFLVGAAYFFYPYEPRGLRGFAQAYTSPSQLRWYAETEVVAQRQWEAVSPRLWMRINTLAERYYGVGMGTVPGQYVKTQPFRFDGALGGFHSFGRATSLGLYAKGGALHDDAAAQITALGKGLEGPIDGAFLGGRAELIHDTRDNTFSARFGGREVLWTEAYGIQGSARSPRLLAGVTLTRFITLRAPDFILAVRGDAGMSTGDRAYVTDYAIGGSDLLRGYYTNRFRGDHFAAATAELRCPIWGPLSAAAFGDVGRVWSPDDGSLRSLAISGGGGLRIGLPPDRMVKLRFDVGVAPDQWGLFFKFNEAF